ncbi:MAG: hypothetical protein ACTHLK_22050 [Brucella intermedia]
MAIRPDYNIGTVSLVASSANFTTSGSSLQTAAVQAGDSIITPSGHVLIIASITGQNSGTLFLPCPAAAAGTALPLRIRFQPDGSRYQGAVRNLIDLLSSGNVEALAALVGADGMVPIFTGPGTLDLADPATFGIQDPNGSLGKLAALTLEASKILNTDASGNLTQSDITAAALAMIASPTPAVTSLGYTPVNKAGDSGLKAMSWDEAPSNWHQRFTATVTLATSANYLFSAGSGLIIATDATTAGTGSVGVFLVGGGGCKLLGQSAGSIFADTPTANTLFMQYSSGSGYYLANATGAGKLLSFAAFRTKDTP